MRNEKEKASHDGQILHKHDNEKSRERKNFYLLRGLLWVKLDGKYYKSFGSTPSGRTQSYSYYITQNKPLGKNIHIPCEKPDQQIPTWLRGITIKAELIPQIREIYKTEINQVAQHDRDKKITEIKKRLKILGEEEARLGRLYITQQINEDTYQQLRNEWREKARQAEIDKAEMQRSVSTHLDGLDAALLLLSRVSDLYSRCSEKQQTTLLQIIAKRIILNQQGEIIDHDLNSPFMYLNTLHKDLQIGENKRIGSDKLLVGAQ